MTVTHLLNVFRHDMNNRALITLSGEIDLDSAPLMRETLGQCLLDGIRTIDVDVTSVTFCDCSGLNTFLHALLSTAAVGGSLQLHYPSPALARLVALTGSGSLFLNLPDALAGSPPKPQPSPLYEAAHPLPPVVPAGSGRVL
ncbi:STAS domain-containing protein [Actinacidiphila oryziradicis]|uniref:Anti-sigma factor antagonist n=1 Tax=Actinacidiphila oryziradicis TaxID=2571141 RepID=A0A4U0T8N6_9ACTN|nr:STAS domain-containing protein [Actinacidiphila oryziradicis]TKA11185.1 STAS domain-containing protein [Actinacidiphila oryziradicis]